MNDTPKVVSFPLAAKQKQAVVAPTPYIEFAVASNFSFLRGASHSEELMLQAAHLQLTGLGLCDRNTVAGVVRAYLVRREQNIELKYHVGARLVFDDGTPDILAYPRDRPAWGRLCRLLTQGNLRAEKGDCILHLDDLLEWNEGLELIVMPECTRETPAQRLHKSRTFFGEESWLGEKETIAAPEHDSRPRESGDPVHRRFSNRSSTGAYWMPAFAGMTNIGWRTRAVHLTAKTAWRSRLRRPRA